MRTAYIGLDLAWSAANKSGAATLRGSPAGAALSEPPTLLGGLDSIVAYVLRQAGEGPAIVAVDAPLLVPNPTGGRPAEAELARIFRRYEAGAHPANRRLLDRDGAGVRGELLVAALAEHGFSPVEGVAAGQGGRLITEVYPHAGMVAMFGLERTLKYKARGRREREVRREAWLSYQAHLRALELADPPLSGHLELLATDAGALRGAGLKGYEDQVDALVCAYIALYAHRWGAARCRTFGDLARGWIFTPVPAEHWGEP